MKPFRSIPICFVLGIAAGCGDSGLPAEEPPPEGPWSLPTCGTVRGTPTIAYTPDEGVTLRRPEAPPAGSYGEFVRSVVAIPGLPNRLLASYEVVSSTTATEAILVSNDSGCSWAVATPLGFANEVVLVSGGANHGYGLVNSLENTSILIVLDGSGAITRSVAFPGRSLGLAVAPTDPLRLRHVGGDRRITSSTDGGANWSVVGTLHEEVIPAGFAAIDSTNLDRIAMAGYHGLLVTSDAGANWTRATFVGASATRTLIFWVVFSADGRTLWAFGRDQDEADAGAPNRGFHLWQSSDGGTSFTSIAEQGSEVSVNAPLVVHPTDPDVLYWIAQQSGDRLFKYSRATGAITSVPLATPIDPVSGAPFMRIAGFHPLDPRTMFFGLLWTGPEI